MGVRVFLVLSAKEGGEGGCFSSSSLSGPDKLLLQQLKHPKIHTLSLCVPLSRAKGMTQTISTCTGSIQSDED